ncbi:MAG: TonB-dependent receptor [Fermentimonas sp.]
MTKKEHLALKKANIRRTCLIMRIFLLFFVLGIGICFSNNSYSQSTRISLHLKNKTVKQVLSEIENNSEFIFFYQDEILDANRKVSVNTSDKSITEILDEILSDTGNSYFVSGRTIYIVKKTDVDSEAESEKVVQQPKRTVRGTVTDSNGEPIIGVTIVVKDDPSQGTVTDLDGNFTLSNVQENAVLHISYVGMKPLDISTAGRNTIDIIMESEVGLLDELVVVGYGTQKKVNLTGAVSSVQSSDLTKRPVTSVQQLLQGKVTGLQIVQHSGRPGANADMMTIRGLGTFSSAGSSPLVLVDGVQGSINQINPNNVENISVLKDASSAAIYGARAANGVILITTKKGRPGEFNLSYHGNFQLHNPTRMPNLITNSAEFMEYSNFTRIRNEQAPYFTQEEIDAYRNNTDDPVHYPNFDWIDYMVKPAFQHNHYLSASGGGDKTVFDVGLGFVDQDGVIDGHPYKKFDYSLNLETKINKRITLSNDVKFHYSNRQTPIWTDDGFVLMIYSSGPHYTPYLSDGSGRYTRQYSANCYHNRNPRQVIDELGSRNYKTYNATGQSSLNFNITEGLDLLVKGAVDYSYSFQKDHATTSPSYYFNNNEYAMHISGDWIGVRDYMYLSILTSFYSTLNYSKQFAENHNINAILGYNQENYGGRYLMGVRTTFPVNYLKELSIGSPSGQSTNGSADEWAIQSLFGRINYGFKERYLFEGNFRYDGTSRIHKDSRWGIFPSFSSAWRLSEESFMDNADWLDNLKLRGSWGVLGNQNIGGYPYQDVLSSTSYPFASLSQGLVLTRLTEKKLRWEKTKVLNFGIDLSVKNNLFALTADWFKKSTSDILSSMPIPMSIGLSAPTVNYASMVNTGFEFELSHMKSIKDFSYQVALNFSTVKNEVTKVLAPTIGDKIIDVGLPYNSHYLIEWIGIFQNQEEIDNGPVHPYNPKPGDLKFKDQNGDGIINSDDRIVVDGAYPKFLYGGSINLSWRNFDLTAFFQGVQGQKFNITGWGLVPYTQEVAPTKEFISQMWTPENPTNKHPAMYRSGYGPVTGTKSTYFLLDASYLRLKNLNINYSVPNSICQKLAMKSLGIYLSMDNLFTITKYPGADPERVADGRYSVYPQLQIYSIGIKANF